MKKNKKSITLALNKITIAVLRSPQIIRGGNYPTYTCGPLTPNTTRTNGSLIGETDDPPPPPETD